MDRFILKITCVLISMLCLCCPTNTLSAGQVTLSDEEREVTFQSGDFILYGTLSIPAHLNTQKLPGVVLVPGSGPQDRDETFLAGGMSFKPFKELSATLKKEGFIVLRYDKREFTMIQRKAPKEAFDTMLPDISIEDASAAIDFIKNLEEVDPQRVFLVGHSEGATLSHFIIINKKLAGVIMLAPGLLQFKDQVSYQLKYQIEFYKNINQNSQFDKDILKTQNLLKEFTDLMSMAEKGIFPPGGYILGASLPWVLRYQELTKNTLQEIVKIKIPVLIINGTKDMLCPAELLKRNEKLLQIKPDLKIIYIDNMIHQLYRAGTADFENAVSENIVSWSKKFYE